MLKAFLNTYKVAFAERANGFIYYLKKLPLVGKKISEGLYKGTEVKLILGIVATAFGFIFGFLRKTLYLGLMIMIPAALISGESGNITETALHIFFFLSLVLGPIVNVLITDNQMEAYKMVSLMRVESGNYFKSKLIYNRIISFIHFLPAMIIFFSPVKGFLLTIELIIFKLLGEAIIIFIYEKTELVLTMKVWVNIGIIGVALVLAYVPPIFGFILPLSSILFSIGGLIVIVLMGALSLTYIIKYKNYKHIYKETLVKVSTFNEAEIMAEATFADVKIDEKKFSKKDLNSEAFKDKEGYEYLNAIFFMRHRKLITIATKKRTVIILLIGIIAVIATRLIPNMNQDLVSTLQKTGAFWVFIMYMLSTTERICKAMFFNCDLSLLRYGYYREGHVILSNFKARLKRVVGLNLIPAAAICTCLTAVIISAGGVSELASMIPIFISILCLSCFFSIHHLFLYYVIQPYTAQMTIKSPLFTIVNMVVYFVAYMCLNFNVSNYIFSIGVILVTIVYSSIALVVTYRVAPRTFKLR